MKTFVIHYSKLAERKNHIINHFEKQSIVDYEFVEKYDQEELENTDKSLFDPSYKLSLMSLMNKSFFVYKEIAEKYDSGLIFEDDVLLNDNFSETLKNYLLQLPEDYDMLFIGEGCNLNIPKRKLLPNKHIYKKCLFPTPWGGDGASRCAHSYIISKKCAIKLCEYIKNLEYKIKVPIDWWLNRAARDNNFKVYWAEPTIAISVGGIDKNRKMLFPSTHF